MIRVLIADDQRLVREGFQVLFSRAKDIEVVGEARDGVKAVEMAATLKPDVVLMDIRMPRLNGLDAARQIVAQGGNVRVLMVAMQCDDDSVRQAAEWGAWGFCAKSEAYTDLVAAVRAVAQGRHYVSASITQGIAWNDSA